MTSTLDFFLPPQNFSDHHKFRGAVRKARGIAPLVDGKAIFSDMERAVVEANEVVLIALWSFQPRLALETKEAKKFGKNWLDLLIATAERGVRVRVFMTDFDPLLQFKRHAGVWLRYRLLVGAAKKAGLEKEQFQVVVSLHEAQVPKVTTALIGLTGLDALVAGEINKLAERERALTFANAPGLWAKLRWNKKTNSVEARKKDAIAPAFPATHHQKLLWIDGRLGFVGGINLIDQNLDTPRHRREKLPWHDLFVRLEGAPLRDIRRNFVGLWNKERKRMESFLKTANATSAVPAGMPGGLTTDLVEKDLAMAAPDKRMRRIVSQVHRTVSKDGAANVPDVIRKDVLEGYLKAIALAEKFIYIENQYLRSQTLADALIAQHKKQKNLNTIIVLPQIAEELLEKKADIVTLHGASLQFDAIDRMQKAIGANLGVFSMVVEQKQIYLHSKLLIVDDRYSNIGSANANPRSFLMDTELNLAWHDTRSTTKLRLKLWRELLGPQSGLSKWKPHQFVARWKRIAAFNARVAPKRRKGFVVPFSNTEKGKPSLIIPDEFAGLLQPGDLRIA